MGHGTGLNLGGEFLGEGFHFAGSLYLLARGKPLHGFRGATATDQRTEFRRRIRIAEWVATSVMPHEPDVRAWLARSRVSGDDIDELIQEAYCRLAMLPSVDHIERADSYFFSIARNLLLRRIKRAQVVPIDLVAEIESWSADDAPSPERHAAGRLEYERVLALIAALPERCSQIVRMRRIEGLSQKEIAARLGVTEKVVEKQVWQGIRAVQAALAAGDAEAERAVVQSMKGAST